MSKPKAPSAPDPKVTAAAQTGTNVSTALANAALGNVNQVTPDGNLTYSTAGLTSFRDPTSGATYSIPQYTATQTLSAAQQAIKDQNDGASKNLATLANNQSGFLTDYLSRPVSTDGLPAAGDASKITSPTYQQYTGGPQLRTSLDGAGSAFQTGIGGAGSIAGNIGNNSAASTTFGGAGDITKSYGTDYSSNVKNVEDALYARVNPQIDRDRASLATSLANQGVKLGSTAYSSAMDDFNRGVNDQRTSITLSAGQEQSRLAGLEAQRAGFQNAAQQQEFQQQAGRGEFANAAQAQNFGQDTSRATFQNAAQAQGFGQQSDRAAFANDAQSRIYDQNLSRAQFGNSAAQQAYGNQSAATEANNTLQDRTQQGQIAQFNAQNAGRQQALSETFASRNQPINEISALLSGSQVSNPNFVPTNQPSIPTVDYAGLVQQNYQSRLGAWQQQNAQSQGLLGGLFGLGSSAILASDRRLKTDVSRVGTGPLGLPIYAFRYIWGGAMRIGFMAQDVAKVMPAAVVNMAGGFLAVDYSMVLEAS